MIDSYCTLRDTVIESTHVFTNSDVVDRIKLLVCHIDDLPAAMSSERRSRINMLNALTAVIEFIDTDQGCSCTIKRYDCDNENAIELMSKLIDRISCPYKKKKAEAMDSCMWISIPYADSPRDQYANNLLIAATAMVLECLI